jgi:hypothetical protein
MPLITNEWDRDNLMFLLTSDDDVLQDWHAQADADDLAYAQELFAGYAEELRLRSELVLVEAEMEKIGFSDANELINKVK